MKKKISSLILCVLMVMTLAGCGSQDIPDVGDSGTEENNTIEERVPKYVFLFIGDGMSYPQIQATANYLGAIADPDYEQALPSVGFKRGAVLDGPIYLNFMKFEAVGSATNYDASSFAPDSSSTATSIATGKKTHSGMLNMMVGSSEEFETIAEKLRLQKGWKIGIVTSVNLNHATPGAFYAHQVSRSFYDEIGEELVESGFDYFAGGEFLGDKKKLRQLAEEAGYLIADTKAEAETLTSKNEKVIVIPEELADSGSMSYEIDRQEGEWALADYVEKGIEVLMNDEGFFMMCEGGKIDWACHVNDAATIINEVLALSDAVQVAVDFATEHPEDTLILVTGDHETGGFSIGFAGTEYDTYLTNLTNQKISYIQFDEIYVSRYESEKTPFEEAMKDVERLFGLKMEGDYKDKLLLTEYEIERLQEAYNYEVLKQGSNVSRAEREIIYGDYSPFAVTITHIMNNKAGIDFTSYYHTGLPVAVYASGIGASIFNGFYDNTDIFNKLVELLSVE